MKIMTMLLGVMLLLSHPIEVISSRVARTYGRIKTVQTLKGSDVHRTFEDLALDINAKNWEDLDERHLKKIRKMEQTAYYLKIEIDILNRFLERAFLNKETASNGMILYHPNTVQAIDRYKKGIIMREELLRRLVGDTGDDFSYIKYPLLSEIKHYNLPNHYYDELRTKKFFDHQKRLNKGYNPWLEEDFFKNEPFRDLKIDIGQIDEVNVKGLKVFFNPYNIDDDFSYYKNYDTSKNPRRRYSRIVIAYDENLDYLSTLFHELGHMVEAERLRRDGILSTYKAIYQDAIQGKKDINYGYWEDRLSENIAEDVKIYLANSFLRDNKEVIKILYYRTMFFDKDVAYPIKKEAFDFLKRQLDYKPILLDERPTIRLSLQDYNSDFVYSKDSFAEGPINKIVTTSSNVQLDFSKEVSYYRVKHVKLYYIGERADKLLEEHQYFSRPLLFNIGERGNYKLTLHLENIYGEDDYITYYLIKA